MLLPNWLKGLLPRVVALEAGGSGPSVATGAEVTTGTNNTKFASPLALRDAGIIPLILPPLTGWTWRNQGDNTPLDGPRSVGVWSPAGNGASVSFHWRSRAVPGGAFRLTAKLECGVNTNAFGGLVFSDGTKIASMGVYSSSSFTGAPHFATYTSATGSQSVPVGTPGSFNQCKWFRLRDTGTNIVGLFSFDERPSLTTDDGWVELYNVSYATAGLSGAPTLYGFGIEPFNTSGGSAVIVINHLDINGVVIS